MMRPQGGLGGFTMWIALAVAFFSLAPSLIAIVLVRLWTPPAPPVGTCVCGYSTKGLQGSTCPECGRSSSDPLARISFGEWARSRKGLVALILTNKALAIATVAWPFLTHSEGPYPAIFVITMILTSVCADVLALAACALAARGGPGRVIALAATLCLNTLGVWGVFPWAMGYMEDVGVISMLFFYVPVGAISGLLLLGMWFAALKTLVRSAPR